jgi:CheY-like chemotaxis protein
MFENKRFTILMADDDQDDHLLMEEAWAESFPNNELCFVNNGEELMDYLYRQGKYMDATTSPRPSLIFLDLNMPRKSGREALKEIKNHPELRQIPVIIFTTAYSPDDVVQAYALGANSFISKPVTFDELVDVMRTMGQYWFKFVHLPV